MVMECITGHMVMFMKENGKMIINMGKELWDLPMGMFMKGNGNSTLWTVSRLTSTHLEKSTKAKSRKVEKRVLEF